jgi:hypothetical protein
MATPSLRHLTLVNCRTVHVEELLRFLEPRDRAVAEGPPVRRAPRAASEIGSPLITSRSITLPRLRRLLIISSMGELGIYLLRSIASSPAATTFHCSSTVPFRPSLHDTFSSALLARAVKHHSSGDSTSPLSMSICFTDKDITLTFWMERQTIADLINPIPSNELPIFQLSLNNCNADLVVHLLAELPVSVIEIAKLQERWLQPGLGLDWRGLFQSMVHLEELAIEFVPHDHNDLQSTV